jgi:hypothetical protein
LLFRNLGILAYGLPQYAYPWQSAVHSLPAVIAGGCPVCDSCVSSSCRSHPDLSLKPLCHTSKVVPIQAATRGTHSGDQAWYIFARSMTPAIINGTSLYC